MGIWNHFEKKAKDDFAQNTIIRKVILVPNVAYDFFSGFWIEEQKLSSNLKNIQIKTRNKKPTKFVLIPEKEKLPK